MDKISKQRKVVTKAFESLKTMFKEVNLREMENENFILYFTAHKRDYKIEIFNDNKNILESGNFRVFFDDLEVFDRMIGDVRAITLNFAVKGRTVADASFTKENIF